MKYEQNFAVHDGARSVSADWYRMGTDSLNGGNVSPGRANSDPGLDSMLQWLDAPVPNFPWYTTGGSFYNQAV